MLKKIYYILEKPYLIKHGFFVQNIILINILINIFTFTLPLLVSLDTKSTRVFDFVQNFTVIIFMVELFARYVVVGINPRYRGIIGRLRYTFKAYTIIDILAIVPFFLVGSVNIAYIRGLRFLRILRLIRMRSIIKRFFSIRSFAMSKINVQIFILFSLSGVAILLFGYIFGSADKSFLIFVDPPGVLEVDGYFNRFFAVLEWIFGLFVGGALISIITSSLVNISKNVQDGYLFFKDNKHIVIIGSNNALGFILKNINQYYIDHDTQQDIVLFLPYMKDINQFREDLKHYSNIDITILTGGAFKWNSYERININEAQKLLILNDESIDEKNHNIELTRYILVNKNFTNKKLSFTIQTRFNSSMTKIRGIYEYIFRGLDNPHLLVNNEDIIKKFLNRSIVDNNYFTVFMKLLSFEGSEFHLLDVKTLFKKDISFLEACMRFEGGVIVGIKRDYKTLLNPSKDKDTILKENDKIIAILKNSLSYNISSNKNPNDNVLSLRQPALKVKRNITIVGDHIDVDEKDISHFLTDEHIAKVSHKNRDEYMSEHFWEEIKKRNSDLIILNLEDKCEFIITMYLRNIYKDDKDFLSKIVNILHDPTTAKLLSGKDTTNNIVLSEKIVGQYISLIMFNSFAVDIFDEITSAKGSEFYILNKKEYPNIFGFNYAELKNALIQNKMIYVGAFRGDHFSFDCKDLEGVDKILVLAYGQDE